MFTVRPYNIICTLNQNLISIALKPEDGAFTRPHSGRKLYCREAQQTVIMLKFNIPVGIFSAQR